MDIPLKKPVHSTAKQNHPTLIAHIKLTETLVNVNINFHVMNVRIFELVVIVCGISQGERCTDIVFLDCTKN
jgi:hypothetical protein